MKVELPNKKTLKNKGGYEGKPQVRFAYSLDGKKFLECGQSYTMKQGKWIGAKFGYVSVETNEKSDRGWIDADWIRVTK